MFNNFQEFFNILPLVIIGAGIVISLLIEMYSKKSETILPWFSVLLFLAAGLHALYYVGDVSIVLQNMLATGGNVNVFYAIFTLGAAVVCMLSIDYIKKYGTYFGEYYIILQTSVLGYDVNGWCKRFICNISWIRINVSLISTFLPE